MASGNPAKASVDNVVKQVRAGIRQGKAPTIPLTNKTKVSIQSTDEDEAEFITRIILANLNVGSNEEFEKYLHAMVLYTTLYGTVPEYAKPLAKELKKVLRHVQ